MDPFERLKIPRALDLDEGSLKTRIQEESRLSHPDGGGNEEDFREVRRAGEILEKPALRIKAVLGLVGEDEPGRGGIPERVMDFFTPVATILEKVSAFVNERGQARSGLGKAVLDVKVPGLKVELERVIADLTELENQLVGRFPGFDEQGWEDCLGEMAEVSRGLTFLGKWQAQLREASGKIFEALLGG